MHELILTFFSSYLTLSQRYLSLFQLTHDVIPEISQNYLKLTHNVLQALRNFFIVLQKFCRDMMLRIDILSNHVTQLLDHQCK